MNDTFYKKVVQRLKTAYAYHKIVCTNDGIPYDAEFIEVNAEFEKLTGLQGDELAGKLASEVLPDIKSDGVDWISIYADVALNKSEREFEHYFESFKRHFKVKVFSPRKFYFITLLDEKLLDHQSLDAMIADQESFRLMSNKELVASEIRYRRLFESAKDGILILEANTGFIIDVNQFLIDLLGYSKEQFINKAIWDIGFFSDIVESKENYLELLKNEYIRYDDLPLRTTRGKSIHVEFVSNVYIEGDKKVVQCNIRDITERFEAKAALNISERKFESYIDHAPGGVFITDENGLIIEANRSASAITGYSVAQLLELTFSDITAEESLANAAALTEVLHESGKMSGELLFKHKSGLKRWWSVDAVKLSEQRYLGFTYDITDKKKADEKDRKSVV